MVTGSDIEEDEGSSTDKGAYLICVGELLLNKATKKKEKEITLGFLVISRGNPPPPPQTLFVTSNLPCIFQAVRPSAGEMVYDEFVDDMESFSELELRLTHLQPVEVLYPSNCSHRVKQTLVNWTKGNGR